MDTAVGAMTRLGVGQVTGLPDIPDLELGARTGQLADVAQLGQHAPPIADLR
jgi:hypothetical protein